MDYYKIGQKIRKIRKAHGLSQEELAEKAGCSWSFLSQLEANNSNRIHAPSLNMVFRLAKALNVPVSKLFEE